MFFGTGNPAPDWDGRQRLGDNLYSDSVVALDADTGKLKWHYQFTPHDELDYDSTQVPVLADIQWQGQPRKVMLWANRNGVHVRARSHDRRVPQGQAVREGELDGRLRRKGPARARARASCRRARARVIQPHVHGATNWQPPSFSPRTGLFYVAHLENSGTMAVEGAVPAQPALNPRQTTMGQTQPR